MELEKFLFCEMARNEANGQVSLIGLHVGDEMTVQLPREIPLQIIPNLSCVVILGDMDRCHRATMQCQVKHREREILNTPQQTTQIPDAKKFYNILLNFSPFPCLEGAGDYEFRVTVQPDSETPTTFSRKFRIERQNTPSSTVPSRMN